MSLYETLKSAKIGAASDVLTTLRAQQAPFAKGGYTPTEKELEGIPPLSFSANGENLIAYSIDGNMTQQGTPNETGEKTINLMFETDYRNFAVTTNGSATNKVQSESTISFKSSDISSYSGIFIQAFTNYIDNYDSSEIYTISADITTDVACNVKFANNANVINLNVGTTRVSYTGTSPTALTVYIDKVVANIEISKIMVATTNKTAFEPYGYKLPIVCGGETNNIYIGANPLRKSLDGTAVDTVSSNGTLTRRVDSDGSVLETPTTETVTAPSIPTINGSNTFNVNTTLAPSNVYIKYKG